MEQRSTRLKIIKDTLHITSPIKKAVLLGQSFFIAPILYFRTWFTDGFPGANQTGVYRMIQEHSRLFQQIYSV